jgi:hypothetical protein
MRSLYATSPRLRSTVIVAGLVALLSIAPAVWAVPGHRAEPDAGTPRALARLGGWLDHVVSGMQSLWAAAGCGMDPNGAPCPANTPAPEPQDGETCDSTTPRAGCSIDPDG